MATAVDINPEPAPRDLSGPPAPDVVMHTDDAPTVPDQTTAPASKQVSDSMISNVNQTDAPNDHGGPSVQSPVSSSPAHITRPLSPLHSSPQAQTEDVTMTPVTDAPNAPLEPSQTPVSQTSTNLPPAPPAAAPVVQTFAKSPDNGASAPVVPHPQPYLENHVPRLADIPLTMVQTNGQGDQGLSARQLGQRARRARERELQAQGLYTPKRRTSSSATLPDPSVYASIQPPTQQPLVAAPSTQGAPVPAPTSGDVTMQSADGDGDDDGEGELEADLAPQSVGPTAVLPAVPPHTASHLIPPIAVLAPVATPSRASLAQRARRERERANRLGLTPGTDGSPNGPDDSLGAPPTYVTPQMPPIPFNPQQLPPGSTHIAALGQIPQQPPTLTRGQLAQRARRARERVERASKAQTAEGWTPSLNTQEGVSSAGEAVFAVAPPPPSANGQLAGFVTTATQHNPGYGVGLGANHVPQQLNRAQLAQRARRARERQQRLSTAASHASGAPDLPHSSPSSSVPPASPTAKQHMDQASRTSLSPVASSATVPATAQLSIGAQFAQVFKSLTAGDNGVSRAVADAGALTSKDDLKARNSTNSPVERMASPTSGQRTDTQDGPDELTDQLSEDSTRATTPNQPADATSPRPDVKALSPAPVEETTAKVTEPEPEPVRAAPRAASPEVHMASVQSVGA